MTLDSNPSPARGICLEAHITALDLGPVRASVKRWLDEAGSAPLGNEVFHAGDATFQLCDTKEGGLSVFLNAVGSEADRTLALHGFDLASALAHQGEVELTWVRHVHLPEPVLIPIG